MSKLAISIVTPEKIIYEEQGIDSISLPTTQGEITILPKHIPLIAKVTPGEIVIRKDSKETSLVTTQGFLKLDSDGSASILADYAIRSEEVEIAKVLEAKKKAEESMKAKRTEKEFAIAEADLRRTLIELKVAQKRRIKIREV
ncbi:ATP synthase F1 subunit epsilon [Candidatus Woesebacteria bacterium RIFCSPLOWO2_01_FULL_37_19]|uniref:ATP synthase epsilon chain n=2 Tax=Candidatus Woeseibacteriota TaxID=1752722 RepID=A0A1F8BAA7_9BACT|nr:MAG: ATP synthase F1 subunit epsilon [Candidatus Woesebacteria bacterium RIFCSPHIGHO2_01_FULL_38_26b]OGM60966.1 MAG: ATP synthase F1 subunit epsilon [Candidatus Woesebacteria bacterium RIFCSPLOWO2_01_FULL_37_19]